MPQISGHDPITSSTLISGNLPSFPHPWIYPLNISNFQVEKKISRWLPIPLAPGSIFGNVRMPFFKIPLAKPRHMAIMAINNYLSAHTPSAPITFPHHLLLPLTVSYPSAPITFSPHCRLSRFQTISPPPSPPAHSQSQISNHQHPISCSPFSAYCPTNTSAWSTHQHYLPCHSMPVERLIRLPLRGLSCVSLLIHPCSSMIDSRLVFSIAAHDTILPSLITMSVSYHYLMLSCTR